jgi:hypothetical protein
VTNLRNAHDQRFVRAWERAYILPFGRKEIDDVRREPPKHAYREIEPVGHHDRDVVHLSQRRVRERYAM